MTSALTVTYRTDTGTRFRVRVRPTDGGWELVRERRVGDVWCEVTHRPVTEVYINTQDHLLL